MSYKSINTHEEVYKVDDKFYVARIDIIQDKLWIIDCLGFKTEYSIDEYENFEGNMEDFVKSKLSKI